MDTVTELERALARGAGDDASAAAKAAEATVARALKDGVADLAYTTVDSPVGELASVCSKRGLMCLHFGADHLDDLLESLAADVSPRIVESGTRFEDVRRQLDEYFAGARQRFELPLDWTLARGGFGRRVLDQAAKIPYGDVITYTEMAGRAGSPRAIRAAGSALGANPIPIVVPCHRVLRTGGALGGYGGGLDRKQFLLELEGSLPGRLG
jgi:methylated-DNA-[protein]-cysteine S-methyltransferase